MPIAYTQNEKTLVAHLAPGITPEQAATVMNLEPGTWWGITEQEAAELQNPPEPTPEEIKAQIMDAIQARLDTFAQTRHYDNIFTAATYATSSVPLWQMEGQYAVAARDATWAAAYAMFLEVEAGVREIPTIEEVMAELPELKWPDEA